NLSLATPDDVPALRNAVEYALRHNVVVVAAAGNDVPDDSTGPFYPAAYPGVLAVGAVEPGGVLARFSDRHTPVGVTAPGVNVTTAYPGTFPAAYELAQNGTSFAAAFVSGVVALVRSAHPGLTAAQVVARIEATARGATGPGTGHGLPGRYVRLVRGLGPRSRPSRPPGAARRRPRRPAGPPGPPRASRPRGTRRAPGPRPRPRRRRRCPAGSGPRPPARRPGGLAARSAPRRARCPRPRGPGSPAGPACSARCC